MYFKQFFDEKLAQYAYMIGCQSNGTAVVIDPMRDIDQYIDAAAKENLTIVAAADTHIHADYISGLREFAERGVKVYASDEGDADWKYEWLNESDYDYQLLKNGDSFRIGNITIEAWHTPGHTPEHISYKVTDGAAAGEPLGIATGDFIFVGDVGRPDLLESAAGQENVMEPSARKLYSSVREFGNVPEYLQIWPGHGAGSACGKALGAIPMSTAGYEFQYNNSLKAADTEEHFVKFILEGQPEPPLYFSRMKRDNKQGPNLTAGPARPRRMGAGEVARMSNRNNTVIIDTRDRTDFVHGHIPGSLFSPLNRQFNTVAGSYVGEHEEIYLVVEEDQVDEAVRDLYRIGLDHVKGYLTPRDLQVYSGRGGKLDTLNTVTFEQLKSEPAGKFLLDVRNSTEYQQSHVDGAVQIAYTRLLEHIESLPKEKTIYLYCQSGARSATASALLKRQGFDVVLIDDEFNDEVSRIAV